jgi:hypothetical protein
MTLTAPDIFRVMWLKACTHPLRFMIQSDATAVGGGFLPANLPCFAPGESYQKGEPERDFERILIVFSRLNDFADFELNLFSWEVESLAGALSAPEGGVALSWTDDALGPDTRNQGARFDLYFGPDPSTVRAPQGIQSGEAWRGLGR